jgi:hypothetical protein
MRAKGQGPRSGSALAPSDATPQTDESHSSLSKSVSAATRFDFDFDFDERLAETVP